MRAVIQRVSRAHVRLTGDDDPRATANGFDGRGLVVLLGVAHQDTAEEAELLADKVFRLRVLAGERSCEQAGAPLLVVSQFTLHGDVRRGRRPSWSRAAPGPVSEPLYETFVSALRRLGARVHTGSFGADMEIDMVNDGPVTLVVDTEELRGPRRE
ncbi:D-aminoacyl-tRNA deacylase [Nesterenkonia sp. F]|uniref:D-aminoacyl-tRNA deacylase n=1 Tax=Nesterenkonia sp. F TaxID=795955 RepID=UPI000255D594|nr:D-aminoacyl-tRNA deacylase [Nesterenkonia sp. F]